MRRMAWYDISLLMSMIVLLAICLSGLFLGWGEDVAIALLPFAIFLFGSQAVGLWPSARRFDWIERFSISIAVGLVAIASTFLVVGAIVDTDVLLISDLVLLALSLVLVPLVLLRRPRPDEVEPASTTGRRTSFFKEMTGRERKLVILGSLFIIVVLISSSYLLLSVKNEHFTEFYYLNKDGSGAPYPSNFTVGIEDSLIVGIANHEGRTVHYYVELWLVNYTNINNSVDVTEQYYVGVFDLTLNDFPRDNNQPWMPQWEGFVPLNFSVPGRFYLYYMLFQDQQEPLPAPPPLDPTVNYARTDASTRVVQCVNNEIQFLRLEVNINPS